MQIGDADNARRRRPQLDIRTLPVFKTLLLLVAVLASAVATLLFVFLARIS